MKKFETKIGLWDSSYKDVTVRKMYDDPLTASMASHWLDQPDILTIEDWGCGYGGFKEYIAAHQTYVGIDGSNTIFADKTEDLVTYLTSVDAIHMRHILEHNQDWRSILNNFLYSFNKRAVLTVFTPFTQQESIIQVYENWSGTEKAMVDISLSLEELTEIFKQHPGIKVMSELNMKTNTQYNTESIFYFEKS